MFQPQKIGMSETICKYGLADVRKTLRDAIDRRDARIATRWTAELVATPGAIGSLWASYWLAWASSSGPTIPILLSQVWSSIVALAQENDWIAFRNNPVVRSMCAEMTHRILTQPRQTPVVWPSKEVILFDVSQLRDAWKAGNLPVMVDSRLVLRVWQRDMDALDLRFMAGQWIDSLQKGDIRIALSVIAWTLLPNTEVKCAERGPAEQSPKQRKSPLWFWLDIGKSVLLEKSHPGWITFHNAVREALRFHSKRFTSADRMRILLAWILQIRTSFLSQDDSIWSAKEIKLTIEDIDRGYQEIAVELSDPNAVVVVQPTVKQTAKDVKNETIRKSEEKLKEADEAVMRLMGIL
jgi:hypothetical protein